MANENTENLGKRLEALESQTAIRNLATAYAIACDDHDLPRLMSLFTEDACFDAPNGAMVANGRSAIEEMFINTFRIRGPSYHWTHDITIDIDPTDPNLATGLVLGHAETSPNGIVSIAAMRYLDTYRREAGTWLFARREIQFLYYVPASQYTQSLNQSQRVVMGDAHMVADYPENTTPWRAFTTKYGLSDKETT